MYFSSKYIPFYPFWWQVFSDGGSTSLCNCCLASNINLVLLGTYVIGKDPRFDPFCVWGNEISMNQHQVRKLIKIVSKMGPKMAIKLFVYTLSKTTANCRMVSKNSAAFFLLPIMSCVRWQCLNIFLCSGCQSSLLKITSQTTWLVGMQRLKYFYQNMMII